MALNTKHIPFMTIKRFPALRRIVTCTTYKKRVQYREFLLYTKTKATTIALL